MNENTKTSNEIDSYIATFSDEERAAYAVAETALDFACVLYHLRQERGLTQQEAAIDMVQIWTILLPQIDANPK